MEQEIQPISLGACIKPFPCVVLVYAESREDLHSKIRKRIIPLAKGPLTKHNSQMTAVDITSTAEQLLQRHIQHLSPVPREQLYKVLGVVGLLIRGADVNTAVKQTQLTLERSSNESSSGKSNLAKKITTGQATAKPKKRVSFKEKPHVQHFTRNSSSDESSEEEKIQVARFNPPSVSQPIHLPSIQLPSTGTRVQLRVETVDSSSESEKEEEEVEEENDNFGDEEEEHFQNEPDDQSTEDNGQDKPQLAEAKSQEEEDDGEDEVVTEDIATEEVISEEEISQQLAQSDQSDRVEREVRSNSSSSHNNGSLYGGKKQNKQNKGGIIEASFSWNLDSEDEEFVF